MITIQILGLDNFVVGQYSREHGENLAQLFETEEQNVSFLSGDAVYFHGGVEQSSWNALIIVRAPHKYEACERQVADYLLRTLNLYTINLQVEFVYFHDHSYYEAISDKYPRFITSDQVREVTAEVGDEEEEGCACDHGPGSESEEEELYTGNAFEGFEERLNKAQGDK